MADMDCVTLTLQKTERDTGELVCSWCRRTTDVHRIVDGVDSLSNEILVKILSHVALHDALHFRVLVDITPLI